MKLSIQYFNASGNWYVSYIDSLKDMLDKEGESNYRFKYEDEEKPIKYNGIVCHKRIINIWESL